MTYNNLEPSHNHILHRVPLSFCAQYPHTPPATFNNYARLHICQVPCSASPVQRPCALPFSMARRVWSMEDMEGLQWNADPGESPSPLPPRTTEQMRQLIKRICQWHEEVCSSLAMTHAFLPRGRKIHVRLAVAVNSPLTICITPLLIQVREHQRRCREQVQAAEQSAAGMSNRVSLRWHLH